MATHEDSSGWSEGPPESQKPQDSNPRSQPASAQPATMPADLRALAARLKGRAPVPENQIVAISASEAFPISALVEEERKRAAIDTQIGRLITGKGIFIGPWEPIDRKGNSLGIKCNVFAAPTDLTEFGEKILQTFQHAANVLSSQKCWHGYSGGYFVNDTALYNALKDGSAIGKWFIPPSDLLCGKDANGNLVRADNNLYALRNTGDFEKPEHAFATDASGPVLAPWYWSCMEDGSNYIYNVDFTDGNDAWSYRDVSPLSCRPCRVELAL